MKKICVFAFLAIVLAGAAYSADMRVGVKGIAGADNSGYDGVLVGGGVDLEYSFGNHLGVAVEADACGSNLTWNDGLTAQDNFYLSVPVMLYYRYEIKKFEFGAGAGLATNFRNDSISVGLSGSLKATYWINDFGISLGVTGVLDCFPSLNSEENSNGSRTYSFKESSYKDNSLLCSLGITYKFSSIK